MRDKQQERRKKKKKTTTELQLMRDRWLSYWHRLFLSEKHRDMVEESGKILIAVNILYQIC